ncbi:MAG: hypothetical protein ACK41C_02515 [Phenylobacterium sp.]|uniref:hypothetical protein n=1 Tax=Phenylobacterium sp. TaxID=1871053 RepID=UPI00391DD992
MSDFLDVPGVSGARYRFRRADLHALPATAGNLLVVCLRKAGPELLLCAAADSLAQAASGAAEALKARRGAVVYIRLNVARAAREAEHADIAALAPEAVAGQIA